MGFSSLVCLKSYGAVISDSAYGYPYRDPYVATTTLSILQGQEKLLHGTIHDLDIDLLPGRNSIEFLRDKGKLRYRFYEHDKSDPLIVLIPGFTGSAYTGSAAFTAEWLADNGFNVIVMPSPFHWNFALAASQSAVPGISSRDTDDMYNAIEAVRTHVMSAFKLANQRLGIVGLSEGALTAARVHQLDTRKLHLRSKLLLMINPPADLLTTIKRIDAMAAVGHQFSAEEKRYIESYAFGVATDSMESNPRQREYFKDWDQRLQLSRPQATYLIGHVFQQGLGDTLYVTELVRHTGILKKPISEEDRGPRMLEAHEFTVMDYVRLVVLPEAQRLNSPTKSVTLTELNNEASIDSMAGFLRRSRSSFLMHNADDIVTGRDEVQHIVRLFGQRALVYPHGGHLGNLWYRPNRLDMLKVLAPLKDLPAMPTPLTPAKP